MNDNYPYLLEIRKAALELGFPEPDLNTTTGVFRAQHPNGNRVQWTKYDGSERKEARYVIKNLVKASGSKVPLSEEIEAAPRRKWAGLLRRNLNRRETYQARGQVMSHLEWIDTRIDKERNNNASDGREIGNLLFKRETLVREMKRLGVWLHEK